jgi:hypothetical protein
MRRANEFHWWSAQASELKPTNFLDSLVPQFKFPGDDSRETYYRVHHCSRANYLSKIPPLSSTPIRASTEPDQGQLRRPRNTNDNINEGRTLLSLCFAWLPSLVLSDEMETRSCPWRSRRSVSLLQRFGYKARHNRCGQRGVEIEQFLLGIYSLI